MTKTFWKLLYTDATGCFVCNTANPISPFASAVFTYRNWHFAFEDLANATSTALAITFEGVLHCVWMIWVNFYVAFGFWLPLIRL